MRVTHKTFSKLIYWPWTPSRFFEKREELRSEVEAFINDELDNAEIITIAETTTPDYVEIAVWYKINEEE